MKVGHSLFDYTKGPNWTLIILFFSFYFLFYDRTFKYKSKLFKKFGVFDKIEGVDENFKITRQINENLGEYWDALPAKMQKRWFAQEVYN